VLLDSLPAREAIEPNLENASYDAEVASSSVSGSSIRLENVKAFNSDIGSGESRSTGEGIWGGESAAAPNENPGEGNGPGKGEETDRVDMIWGWSPGKVALTALKGVRGVVELGAKP